MSSIFDYDRWPSRAGEWKMAERGNSKWDHIDFHVDLGCGKLPKGRIGVDRYPAPGVAVVVDMDKGYLFGTAEYAGEDAVTNPLKHRTFKDQFLPFDDNSIKSIISHHFFEHVGDGFIPLMDEIYRVLEPGGILRAITPLFPSWAAVADPDHKRYFMAHESTSGGNSSSTWDVFCGTPDNHWMSSFSVPYTKARFTKVDQQLIGMYSGAIPWSPSDCPELRVALKAEK